MREGRKPRKNLNTRPRITPAYAGRTHLPMPDSCRWRDHPRVCGKDAESRKNNFAISTYIKLTLSEIFGSSVSSAFFAPLILFIARYYCEKSKAIRFFPSDSAHKRFSKFFCVGHSQYALKCCRHKIYFCAFFIIFFFP